MNQTTKLSLYKNSKDNSGYKGFYHVEQVVNGIKGNAYKDVTDNYRTLFDSEPIGGTPEDFDAWKKKVRTFKELNFKGVTWSGAFSARNTKSLVEHSGLMCLDFDKIPLDELAATRLKLIQDPHTMVLFISPSRGLKVVVKVEDISAETHKECFKYLQEFYDMSYSLEVDPLCKNVDRLCFLCHDEQAFYNPNSYPFKRTTGKIIATGTEAVADLEVQVEEIVRDIEGQKKDITSDYGDWIKLGMALANLGEIGRGFFHRISSFHKEYDAEECDYKFSNFLQTRNGTVQMKSFFFVCKNHGFVYRFNKSTPPPAGAPPKAEKPPVTPGIPEERAKVIFGYACELNRLGRSWTHADITQYVKQGFPAEKVEKIFNHVKESRKDEWDLESKPDIYKVELFLRQNYEFYKNEITQRVEFRPLKSQEDFVKMSHDSIFRHLQHSYSKFPLDKLKSLLRSDFVPVRNPMKDYFTGLPSWSEAEGDVIEKLSGYIKTDNDDFWRAMFKKALVRSIACAIAGRENRYIMVLVGEKQHTGKTSFIRFLNPFGTKYYTESPLREGKDTEIRFSENFIYNLEELSHLNSMDVNKLKAIISRSTVKERKAYAEDEEEQPRRCNFWGSTNKPEFLADTENTRWLCFNVESISHQYNNKDTGVQEIDINRVWAQAYHLFATGFNYQLTEDERVTQALFNKNYEQSSNERDFIIKTFIPGTETNGKFMSTGEIIQELNINFGHGLKFNDKAIGRAMIQLGFPAARRQVNGHRARGYMVIPINALNVPQGPPEDGEEPPF